MDAARQFRNFAAQYDLIPRLEWVGEGHKPWVATLRFPNGKQVGHGEGKYPETAVERAIDDAKGEMGL